VLGSGYNRISLDPARDYIVALPPTGAQGVTLDGGHNVVLIGGRITVPADLPAGRADDALRRGLYVKGATGTVHVEGVLFEGAPGAVWDAIDIAAPAANVQLENIRVEGVHGGFHSFHADVVQPWGGVRSLRIDRLTATSNYQGLMIPVDQGPILAAHVSRVDLRGLAVEVDGNGHLLWLTSGSRSCRAYPVDLFDVWVQARPGTTVRRSLWPEPGHPAGCAARARRGRVSWPRLPVRGVVHAGAPPGGSFVPPGLAGPDYVSPGYRVER